MFVLSSILISSIYDLHGTENIVSLDSYLYFPSWHWYYCILSMYKQICLAVRFQGEKLFGFWKKMVAAHCLVEMVGEGKMEVQVPVSVNLLIVCCSILHSLHCLVAGVGAVQVVFWAAPAWFLPFRLNKGGKKWSHIKMPQR